MIVLDASVVIKWFQEEENSDQAVSIQKQHSAGENTIIVPDLLFYEVANVLRYKKEVTQETITNVLDFLHKAELRSFALSPIELREVIIFARMYDITVYDALYVVLAQQLKCSFVTADRNLQQKLKECSWIKLLTDEL